MRLAVVPTATQTCFVNLPPQVVNSIFDQKAILSLSSQTYPMNFALMRWESLLSRLLLHVGIHVVGTAVELGGL